MEEQTVRRDVDQLCKEKERDNLSLVYSVRSSRRERVGNVLLCPSSSSSHNLGM